MSDDTTVNPDERPRLTLYQAEWCPYSSAVREVLTELGLDVVLRQVEPIPEQRNGMREATGTDSIPVLVAEDGSIHQGTRAIFAHLRERDPGRVAAGHRRQFADHREAREADAAGRLIERFRSTEELREADEPVRAAGRDAGS
jgi:glutathione S-transferase